jgi:hypothetical protein
MPAPRPTAVSALALVGLLGASVARAEPPPAAPAAEAKKAPAPIVPATDAEAEAALATYKEEWKAKGLTGDDRVAQREFAMSRVAKVQHPKVVDALGAVSRSGDKLLRTLAVIYLGEQRAFPGLAGPHVVAAAKKSDDPVLLMSALQSIGRLRYLGARDFLRDALQHQDYAVKKVAILSIGETGDLRLLSDVARVVGLHIEKEAAKSEASKAGGNSSSGKEEKTEGYSWDGVEVTYDTGTAGDGDQQMAEKIGKEQMAANEAAAKAGAGGGGSGAAGASAAPGADPGGGGGGGLGGGSARSPEELLPNVLLTLHRLTGQKFKSPGGVVAWSIAHKEAVAARLAKLDSDEKAQRAKK